MTPEAKPDRVEATFTPVDIELLEVGSPLGFGLFMETSSREPAMIAGPEERLSLEAKRRLVKSGGRFFVEKANRRQYYRHLEDSLKRLMESGEGEFGPTGEKEAGDRAIKLVFNLSYSVMEEVFENPSAEVMHRARQVVCSAVDAILSHDQALNLMVRLARHDHTTYTHSCNVGVFGMGLVKSLLKEGEEFDVHNLGTAFFFHDIGKVEVGREIINKPGPLNIWEVAAMRRHTKLGAKIMKRAGLMSPEAAAVITQHHERFDGSGYPMGLTGESIHPHARICAIADVFDALTSDRPYRRRLSPFQAVQIMRHHMPGHFEPGLIRRFVLMFR